MFSPRFPAGLWITLFLIAFFAASSDSRPLLEYQRSLAVEGEWWRLISCHFVHLSSAHFFGNAAGLLLVWLITRSQPSAAPGIISITFCCVFVGLGLHLLAPDLAQYVGFSGTLHGMLMISALGMARRFPEYYFFALFLCAKVAWEFSPWYDDQAMQPVIGGRVEYRAHALGLLAGGALHTIVAVCGRLQSSRRSNA